MFFCFVYILCHENISKYLIVNMNQIVVFFVLSGQDNTYKVNGAKQVRIYKKRKKDIYSCLIY